MNSVITINTSQSYNIYIKTNILENIPTIMFEHYQVVGYIIVICDSILKKTYGNIFKKCCASLNLKTYFLYLDSTEKNKNFDTIQYLCNRILNITSNRQTPIVALGGGVIGDIAGFCASILLRGVPYFHIPTTLLAQIDSSIGGKTGVNTSSAKNSIGSFYQPKAVFIDPTTLHSLSNRNFLSGYAECLKYALLYDAQFFTFLDQNIEQLKSRNLDIITDVIYKCLYFKKNVVEDDEFETKNKRILLNLGHTFAHAIEKYNNYSEIITHGEAVSIGILFAFACAEKNHICNISEYQKIYTHLSKTGLPINLQKIIPNISATKLVKLMKKDKKNTDNNISLVLPKKIGQCIVYNISPYRLEQFINDYFNSTHN